MKRTQYGIVRKIDKIGRLVIPIEYYKKLGISREDEVEIFSTNDEIVIRKYNEGDKLERDFDNLICKYGVDKVKEICKMIQILNNDFNGGLIMDIEEMMIDYIMNNATQEEVEEFFGYAAYGICTREECENNLAQMPDEEFDMFVKKFGIPTDGIKL